MVRKSTLLALMLVTSMTGSASLASASDRSVTRTAPKTSTVVTVNAQLNGQMAVLFFLGDQAMNGFQFFRGIVGVGKLPTQYQIQTADSPDGIDPIGVKNSGGVRNDGPLPAPANNRVP